MLETLKTPHYFDSNATSTLFPGCEDYVVQLLKSWGNPSSIHWASRQPKTLMREARQSIAQFLNAHPLEVVFTSGGTESNTTVIEIFLKALIKGSPRNHFMCSAIEHPSVLKTFNKLKDFGAQVDVIPVSQDKGIDLDFIKAQLSDKTALVSVMMANNETGLLLPIKEIAEMVHQVGAYFHTDGVQALGKHLMDLKDLNVDYASFSAHKVNALKGTGILYINKKAPFESLFSGAQERSRRGGTENVLGISVMAQAIRSINNIEQRVQKLGELRNHFESRIKSELPGIQINSENLPRLSNTSSLLIEGIDGESLLMSLDLKSYAVSTGAACSSGSPEPSPVLLAIGLTKSQAQSSLRVSFGIQNTMEETNQFIDVLITSVRHLRKIGKDTELEMNKRSK